MLLLRVFAFIIVFGAALCQKFCHNLHPPGAPSPPLQYCTKFGTWGCCNLITDRKIHLKVRSLPSSVSLECRNMVKEMMCQKCSQYSGNLFDFYGKSPLPGMCKSDCYKFYKKCKSAIKYLVGKDITLYFKYTLGKKSFCKFLQPLDPAYCYPKFGGPEAMKKEEEEAAEKAKEELDTAELEKQSTCVCFEQIKKDFHVPVDLTSPNDGSKRIFVTDLSGQISVFDSNGTVIMHNFFNLDKDLVFLPQGPELGFLGVTGLAFHPKFRKNGRFFVSYTIKDPVEGSDVLRISEYRLFIPQLLQTIDWRKGKVIMNIPLTKQNNVGGELLFGDDGYLMIFLGDNSDDVDPDRMAQKKWSYYGKVLRIDVDDRLQGVPYGIPEDNPYVNFGSIKPQIYASGFRSPWRCGVDRGDPETGYGKGRVICVESGYSQYDEVNYIKKGANYGWSMKEGTSCWSPMECEQENLEDPIFSQMFQSGMSLVGGAFYRGCIQQLHGTFVFGRWGDGKLYTVWYNEGKPGMDGYWEQGTVEPCGLCPEQATDILPKYITAIREGEYGEMYVLTIDDPATSKETGKVFKMFNPNIGKIECFPPPVFDDDTGDEETEVNEEDVSGAQDAANCACFEPVKWDFYVPVQLISPNDGSGRIFIADLEGKVSTFDENGVPLISTFFELDDKVYAPQGPQQGFLGLTGMTFHPNFKENGKFYISYTSWIKAIQGFVIKISEYETKDMLMKIDQDKEKVLLQITIENLNNVGGELIFDEDGYLLIFVGDNSPDVDGYRNAQKKDNFLGKVLRIDVDNQDLNQTYSVPDDNPFVNVSDDVKPEIFASGLRNPWRCGVDRGDPYSGYGKGRIICVATGHSSFDEMNLIKKGKNYGWSIKEGWQCWSPTECEKVELTDPVFGHDHKKGFSLIGGAFYRGCIKYFSGTYIYGEWGTGKMYKMWQTANRTYEDGGWENGELEICSYCPAPLTRTIHPYITAVREDDKGELFVLAIEDPGGQNKTGKAYKIVSPHLRKTKCVPPKPAPTESTEETKSNDDDTSSSQNDDTDQSNNKGGIQVIMPSLPLSGIDGSSLVVEPVVVEIENTTQKGVFLKPIKSSKTESGPNLETDVLQSNEDGGNVLESSNPSPATFNDESNDLKNNKEQNVIQSDNEQVPGSIHAQQISDDKETSGHAHDSVTNHNHAQQISDDKETSAHAHDSVTNHNHAQQISDDKETSGHAHESVTDHNYGSKGDPSSSEEIQNDIPFLDWIGGNEVKREDETTNPVPFESGNVMKDFLFQSAESMNDGNKASQQNQNEGKKPRDTKNSSYKLDGKLNILSFFLMLVFLTKY